MKRSLFFLIFALCLFSTVYAKSLSVSTRAEKAILLNPENGAILYEKKAHQPHVPASLTKIVTGLYLLDHLQPSLKARCVASQEALEVIHADIRQADITKYPSYILEHDGTMMGLSVGHSYCLETLLYALLLNSSNDAANVLAETTAGSIPTFVQGMNQYLMNLGFTQTSFQNPSGFYHPAQWTTAYEMAKIAGIAFRNPIFSKIIQTTVYEEDPVKKITTYNRMMKEGKYQYTKAIGAKTGYLESSGYNLVAAAEDGGRLLIGVVLGCKTSNERYEDLIALFEAAFAEKKQARLLFTEGAEFQREIEDSTLKAGLKNKVELDYFPSEEGEMEAKVVWYQVKLPIAVGAQVGELNVTNEHGYQLASAPLLALNEVQAKGSSMWMLILTAAVLIGIVVFAVGKKRRKLF